jgi:hypothetical protein
MRAHEIGDRHLAREDECNRPREEPEHQQDAADEFKHAGETNEREERRLESLGGPAEELRRAMREEQQRRHDPEDGQELRTVGRQELFEFLHGFFPSMSESVELDRKSLRHERQLRQG